MPPLDVPPIETTMAPAPPEEEDGPAEGKLLGDAPDGAGVAATAD